MSKIKFEDGTVVNFNGNPTKEDIEEIAKKLELEKTKPKSEKVKKIEEQNKPLIEQGKKAEEFLKKPWWKQLTSVEFRQEVPKTFESIGTGMAKGATSTFIGLGQATLRLARPISEKGRENIKGGLEIGKEIQQKLKPQGTAETMGYVGEQLAETYLTGKIVGSGKSITQIAKLPSWAQRMIRIGESAGRSYLTGAAYSGFQEIKKGTEGKELIESANKFGIESAKFGAILQTGIEAIDIIGNVIKKVGQKIQFSVLKPNKADIADGFKVENVNKYKLGGNVGETLEKGKEGLKTRSKELKTVLSDADGKVDLNNVLDRTKQRLAGQTAQNVGVNKAIQNELTNLGEEIKIISEKPVNLLAANTVKQGAGQLGAWAYGKPEFDAQAKEIVYNTFYYELKTAIEKTSQSPQVAILNKEIQEILSITNAALRRLPVAERNQIFGLTEAVGAAMGTIDPRSFAIVGASIAQKSGKAGQALVDFGEFLKKSGKIPPELTSAIATIETYFKKR